DHTSLKFAESRADVGTGRTSWRSRYALFSDQEARMPLHVDRTSVQTHQSRGEHVLELAAARARQAAAGPDAAKQLDDASPVLRLVGVTTPDTGDVESI